MQSRSRLDSHFAATRRSRRGFTLIELIVVLVILATVAGMVIPAVASLGRSTDMAASAKTQQDLGSNLQQFFVLQKRFPQGVDSLLQLDATGGTTPGAPTGLYAPLLDGTGQQVSGMTASSPNLQSLLIHDSTTVVNATGSELARSLTRAGFEYVNDHQSYDISVSPPVGEPNANNSGKVRRTLVNSSTVPIHVARR
jgi:prepilin-type N-terminal cleavage/methylation domain-containing protein